MSDDTRPGFADAPRDAPASPFMQCAHCGEAMRPEKPCPSCGRASPSARIGQVLAGKYRVEAVLGQGGFGVVYRGTHLSLGGDVAIKFLLTEWTDHAHPRVRFKREAEVLAKLRHPGIVSVFDFGEDGGDLYLVMELVRGTVLSDLLSVELPPFSFERIGGILVQVLEVLEAAHGAGIVHRDLKPDNIMLLDAGDGVERVKVLDFGLALDLEAGPNSVKLTATQTINGTPNYMSPEQCRGQRVDPASDIYTLGVIFYELIAGERPFIQDEAAALFAQHMFVDAPPLEERGYKRAAPLALAALVKRAMAKKPQERPTAPQLRAALEDALRGIDPISLAARGAADRAAVGALSRSERAIKPQDAGGAVTVESPMSLQPRIDGEGPCIALWGFSPKRLEDLRAVLAVNGASPHACSKDETPPSSYGEAKVAAILLAAGPDLAASLSRARTAGAPILVVGLEDASALPSLIRAGAADVVMNDVDDTIVCQKAFRLVKRRR